MSGHKTADRNNPGRADPRRREEAKPESRIDAPDRDRLAPPPYAGSRRRSASNFELAFTPARWNCWEMTSAG
jgi:hypothetical protein